VVMTLPFIKTDNQAVDLLETKWKSELDPLLAKPLSSMSILPNVALVNGVNVINHLLGRTPQGWFFTDINAAATVFRSAAFSNLTLTLTSNAACTVSLAVF
jgi:hypothetical protein